MNVITVENTVNDTTYYLDIEDLGYSNNTYHVFVEVDATHCSILLNKNNLKELRDWIDEQLST